jgi:IS5 family transposase
MLTPEAELSVVEEAARKMGVDYVSIPNRSTRSEERSYKSVDGLRTAKRVAMRGPNQYGERRHGLERCPDGMWRWVGLGIVADNLISIGRHVILKTA